MKIHETNDGMTGGRFLVGFGQRLFLFACVTVICFLIGAVAVSFIISKGSTPAMRVSAIVQDMMLFIVPALATACLITRQPARFLMVETVPSFILVILAIGGLYAAVPLMNMTVTWNESISLPPSLKDLEDAMRQSEDAARASIALLIGDRHSIGSLIMAILIVGVMAGFSEEIFFRGTMQRLLTTGPINAHVAIWITAFMFSAIHMQFYGFVPRLLLGAYFGYLAWWTRSLWIPVIVHVINNTTVIIGEFMSSGEKSRFDTIGATSSDYIWVAVSAIMTVLLIVALYKITEPIRR